jgi:hypothetical protein
VLVSVKEQLPLSVKLPGPLEAKLTNPAGVPAVPASVSVIVAVQVACRPATTVVGEHSTTAKVARVVTVISPTPTLAACERSLP